LRDPEDVLGDLDDVVGELVGQRVSRIFGHVKSWTADPYARALVRLPIGDQRSSAVQVVAAPLGGRVFFAGEHTDMRSAPGGMEGAIRSGLRASDEVLASV
jgi:monoamine oxidase